MPFQRTNLIGRKRPTTPEKGYVDGSIICSAAVSQWLADG